MKPTLILYLILFSLPIITSSDEDCVKHFLEYANKKLSRAHDINENRAWEFYTNLTTTNNVAFTESQTNMAQIKQDIRKHLIKLNSTNFQCPLVKRQIKLLTNIGDDILPADKLQELTDLTNSMLQEYSTVTVPGYHDPAVVYTFTDITEISASSVNPAELKYYWVNFTNELGTKLLPYFPKYVTLKNEATTLLGYPSTISWYNEKYEEPDFYNLVQDLVLELKPLYVQIHAYIRFRLRQFYGELVSKSGCIPVHLVGNVEMQNFQWMARNSLPFENRQRLYPDYLKQFKKSRSELYHLVDDFFVSMNLSAIPQCVWKNSTFTRLSNQQICRPTLFLPYKNYRILDCSTPEDLSSLTEVFACVGDLQSLIQAEHQPFSFWLTCNNRVLSWTIGYLFALSLHTSKFYKILSIDNSTYTDEDSLNRVFVNAMETVPEIVGNYMVSEWKRSLYQNVIKEGNYNSEYWELMHKHLGLEPPMHRPSKLFDVSIRYRLTLGDIVEENVLARIISYQLHKELCLKTGEYVPGDFKKPLHECCLYGYKLVGDLLSDVLKAGGSKKWNYCLKVVTGTEEVSSDALLEYYEPLRKWLEETNRKNSEEVGWKDPKTIVIQS